METDRDGCCCSAACAAYRGKVDATLTAARRTSETCRPQIRYGEQGPPEGRGAREPQGQL